MKLAEKGHAAPPPQLPPHAQWVAEQVSALPGVQARCHWLLGDETQIDGADFYRGQEEVGHIHLYGEAHVALPRIVGARLVELGVAKPFPWSKDFVVVHVNARSRRTALWLFELAHRRCGGASNAELLGEIARGAPHAEADTRQTA